MNSITDKVIAYRLPQDGAKGEAYGVCLRSQGNTLRVILLEEGDKEKALKSVLRRLSDEDVVVKSLESRLQLLQSQRLEEPVEGRPNQCLSQETLLRWAIHHLEKIREDEWALLVKERCPSAIVSAVGCTLACIVAGKKLVSFTWSNAQRLLCSGKALVEQLRQLGEKRMERSLYDFIEKTYLSDETLSYSSLLQESPSLVVLHKWITAFMDYQCARYMGNSEMELRRQVTDCQSSLRVARERRSLLENQVGLINTGNCYSRTKIVHSVPTEHVLCLMTAEKVTTRQFLLKDRIPRESLGEMLAASLASPHSNRSDIPGARSRMSPFSSDGSDQAGCTLTSALMPSASEAEAAHARSYMKGLRMQRSRASIGRNDNVDSLESCHPSTTFLTDALSGLDVGSHFARALGKASGECSSFLSSDGKAAVAGAIATTTTEAHTVSVSSIQIDKRNSAALLLQAPSAASASENSQSLLADVKNHFENVQETLLECFEEYRKLEEKYLKTVEQSRQLLQTLEGRDKEVGRLRDSLSHAIHGQLLAGRVIARLQQNQHSASKGYPCNGHQGSANEAYLHLDTSGALDADSFSRKVEFLLEDTLDYLRGAASTLSM